jgi:hypothetical protein
MRPMQGKIRIKAVETLSDDWYVLKKTTFDLLRRTVVLTRPRAEATTTWRARISRSFAASQSC